MNVEQRRWTHTEGWSVVGDRRLEEPPDLVFAFGSTALIENEDRYTDVRNFYPNASIVGGSTGGEIQGTRVLDDTLVTAAIAFQEAAVRTTRVQLDDVEEGEKAGMQIAESLLTPDLAHVLVLSDGVHVNGSELIQGMATALPDRIEVTGGLAADGDRFERTPLWLDGVVEAPSVVGVGFYGEHLRIGHGSLGGWDPFGPQRRISRSKGNVLYELDGQSALELYKKYLGPHAERLPASGLLFPLAVQTPGGRSEIVRSVIGIDEEAQSITFAGDVPQGAFARFMKTNNERLIDGAIGAAKVSRQRMEDVPVEFALLVSCIGRKQVLKQRIEEEIEHAATELGEKAELVGFYSYGEISPAHSTTRCELHNQTMTITTLAEVESS